MLEWIVLILLIPAVLVPVVLLYGFSGCDLVFKLEGRVDFEKAFEVDLPNESQRPNRTVIVRVEPIRLFDSGPIVRITIQRPKNNNLVINAMYISQVADTGDPYDAASDLTPVLAEPLVVTADPAGGTLVLDQVDYNLDASKPLLIAFDLGADGNMPNKGSVPATEMRTFVGPNQNPVIHEAALADRQSGYLEEQRIHLIKLIEVGQYGS